MASTTTKAWTYSRRGLPRDALTLRTTHPVPEFPPASETQKLPGKQEEWLLLRVSFAALNPGDVVVMAFLPGFLRSGPARAAAVPCYDLTATVLDVWTPPPPSPPLQQPAEQTQTQTQTEGKRRFRTGEEVVAFVTLNHMRASGVGGLQGIVAVPARYAVKLPPPVAGTAAGTARTRDAAGLLLTGCTALQMARDARLREGQRVLVYAASGGVGSAAVQVVRELVGGEGLVVGVCSGRNVELVKGLGADEVIDYSQYEDLAGELVRRYGEQPFDAVIDAYGQQALFNHCAGFLKEEGIYAAAAVHCDGYAAWPVLKSGMTLLWNGLRPRSPWLGGTGRAWKAVSMMDPGVEMMERVVSLFGEGKLRVVVDSEWPFEQVLDAYDVLCSGRARGKVIIRVESEEEEQRGK